MSIMDVLQNPTIFPEPNKFKPERWLQGSEEKKAALEQYFVPFGKGGRACQGMT